MLIGMIAALILGSAGTSSLLKAFDRAHSSVGYQIADQGRRDALIRVIEDAERSMKRGLRSRAKATSEVATLARSYDTQPAEIERVLDGLRADARAAQEEAIARRFALKERLSREEWQRIFSPR
jgi:hypothetical protein